MRKILFFVLMLAGVMPAFAQKENRNAELAKQLEIFNQLYRQLDQFYVDTLDAKKNIENAILYMLAQLDPYTVYYPDDHVDDLKQMTTGKYAGIGSLTSLDKSSGRCAISGPYKGMPAANAGLRIGDIILSIDGVDTGVCGKRDKGEFLSKVSEALRGDPGTTFTLKVKRPYVADTMTFQLKRAMVALPSIPYKTVLSDSIGYIMLDGYTEHTSRDLRMAVEELKRKGIKRLVLDLRGNGGGLMLEAVNVVNLFVPRGLPVVSTKGKLKEMSATYKTQHEPLDTEIPLVVMTDFGTASSAEITSGALQDYDRAVIVGGRTYGKGLVQQSRPLGFDAVLKLTTSKYYIPSGRCIQAYKFENGEPKHLPDSLSKEFHTAAGRIVRDGGGIMPDVEVKGDSLPGFLDQLNVSDALLDYWVYYRNTHDTIAPPAQFHLTEAEYEDFKAFMKKKHFVYDRRSKKMLELLRMVAKNEGYAEVAKAEFDALEAKLVRNEDYDYQYWEKDIRRIVEMGIVNAFYYGEGAAAHFLPYDKDLKEALRVLQDDRRYREILSAPKGK